MLQNLRVVFISNFFNHHQKPCSDAMYELCNGNYKFIAMEKMSTPPKISSVLCTKASACL